MPTNTTIPTLSTGNVLSAADWNDLVPLNTSVGLFGLGNLANGSTPGLTAPNFYIQAGEQGVSFSSGVGTLTYPTAFPNGVVVCFIQVKDPTTSVTTQAMGVSSSTASSASLTLVENGTAVNSNYPINFFAIGF